MNRIDIDYPELEAEVINFIKQNHTWVLATAANNHVTARSISTVNSGWKIYFQTDSTFTKYKQLTINPNVALCYDNYQIEGIAKRLGHPQSANNKFFCDLFKKHHPLSFTRYSSVETEAVVEVSIKQVFIWKHVNNETYRDCLFMFAQNAYREEYIKQEL